MNLHIISSAIFVAIGISLSAQDLSKEIVIEKDIIPQERQASRHNIAPSMSLSPISVKPLSLSEGAAGVQVPGFLSPLEPAQGSSSIGNSPYRGYAGIGCFPHPNFGASAGYRVLASATSTLDIYGQYNFNRYERENIWGTDVVNRKSALTLGALFSHRIDDQSSLQAAIDYSLYNFNVPLATDGYNQRANRLGIGLDWASQAGNLSYNIGLRYGYFGFAHIDPALTAFPSEITTDMEANNENGFSITGGVSIPAGEDSKAGIDLDASFLSYNGDVRWERDFIAGGIGDTYLYPTVTDGLTRGAISLTPYYSCRTDVFDARIGADVSFAVNSGGTLHIAPDVNLSWKPASSFGVWAKVTGGRELNSMRTLFDDCWYMNPLMAHRNSDIKYDMSIGMNVGPVKGFTGRLYGGYAATDGWLMPSLIPLTDGQTGIVYSATDLKGWRLGASLAYDYRGIAALEVSYEMAPSKYDKGYHAWRDRAKRVLSATLAVCPISPLKVTVNYTLRQDRATYLLTPYSVGILTAYNSHRTDLGDVDMLNLGASYAVTKQLSIFGEINNLLGNDWQECYGVTAAPINGLIGVGYKF